MNPRDLALQTIAPMVMVPKFEELQPLQTVGHRFLAAADGTWLELRRAWLYARVQVVAQHAVPMPYGTVEPTLQLLYGTVPKSLLSEFIEQAKAGLPNEVAAAVIWNERTGDLRLQPFEAVTASPGHITYRTASIEAGENVVMDLHSHGTAPAFFSRTDNQDDKGAVKVAGVVGNLDKPEQSFAFRLCALGLFIPL